MIDSIQKGLHALLLANIPTLCQGGTAHTLGWPGVTRDRTHQVWDSTGLAVSSATMPPLKGYINLFDRPYSKDTREARPGIYLGLNSHEYSDRQDGSLVTAGQIIVHRLLDIPFVIVVSDDDYYICRDMRNQLRDNVAKIILANILSDTWWSLQMPGEAGGGELAEHAWMTDTGQGDVGQVEGFSAIPMRFKYSFSASTPA